MITRLEVEDYVVEQFLNKVLKQTGDIDFVIAVSPRRNFIFNTLRCGYSLDEEDKYVNLRWVAKLLGIDEFYDWKSWEDWKDSLVTQFEEDNKDTLIFHYSMGELQGYSSLQYPKSYSDTSQDRSLKYEMQ